MFIYTCGIAVMSILLYEAFRILRADYVAKKAMARGKSSISKSFVELWQDETGLSRDEAVLYLPIPGELAVEYNVYEVPVICTIDPMDHNMVIACTRCDKGPQECIHEKAVRILLESTKHVTD